MKIQASVCRELKAPWATETVDVDEPKDHEVLVRMAYAGLCHSDEHLRDGTTAPTQEMLDQMGVESAFPVVGGHEGSGVVEAVGPSVIGLAPGDKVAVSFIPACGTCFWCASGRQNLCDLGAHALAGPSIAGGYRYRLEGANTNRMAQLGTFAEIMVCHEASLIKLASHSSLKAAALISWGLSTGYGSVVERAAVKPGETVVVIGCGGLGSGAIQGARIAGARHIVAVDPVAFKTEKARQFGATHTAASIAEAMTQLPDLTEGRMADVVVLTPGVLTSEFPARAQALASKDARIVLTAMAPMAQTSADLNIFQLAMYNQALLGTVFGSASPRVQVPNLLRLHEAGLLKIDEMVTREYSLDTVQHGYDDLHAGKNIRGLVAF